MTIELCSSKEMALPYFLGLEEYTYEDVFDRSLITTLRYRLGVDKPACRQAGMLWKVSITVP